MNRSSTFVVGFVGSMMLLACSSSSNSGSSPITPKMDSGRPSNDSGGHPEMDAAPPPEDSGQTTETGAPGDGSGGDAAPTNPYECTVPATPPSNGSCVTTVAASDSGAGIQCNPVTNEGCTGGAVCDTSADMNGNLIGFVCYPPPNTQAVCQTCDDMNGPYCAGGETCIGLNMSGTVSVCAHYCCTDADCGSGKCTTTQNGMAEFGPIATTLGTCTVM